MNPRNELAEESDIKFLTITAQTEIDPKRSATDCPTAKPRHDKRTAIYDSLISNRKPRIGHKTLLHEETLRI